MVEKTGVARIYKPARTAMQSGEAQTKRWVLEYELAEKRSIEPLMGWTSSGDMKQQIQLHFNDSEAAVAYAERQNIAYEVYDPRPRKRRAKAYADNFSFSRREMWTH